jgi:hypothetical protein
LRKPYGEVQEGTAVEGGERIESGDAWADEQCKRKSRRTADCNIALPCVVLPAVIIAPREENTPAAAAPPASPPAG